MRFALAPPIRAAFLIAALSPAAAAAQVSYQWQGSADGQWSDASRWAPNGTPGSSPGDKAQISTGATVTLSTAPAQPLSGLLISSGSQLVLGGAAWTLDVTSGAGIVTVGDATPGTLVFDDDNGPASSITLMSTTMTVSSMGRVHADSRGAAGALPLTGADGLGLGGGHGAPLVGGGCLGGGGYGGIGGTSAYCGGGRTYGSYLHPTDVGSGGGGVRDSPERGGAGAGRIRLKVAAALTLDGYVSAVGEDSGNSPGAGSGGSVWITAGSVGGVGEVSAKGGAAFYAGGGGGGGRIAIDGYTGALGLRLTARGDSVRFEAFGGAGTIALTPRGAGTTVIVDQGFMGNPAPTPLDDLVADELVLRGGSRVEAWSAVEVKKLTVPAGEYVTLGLSYVNGGYGILSVRAGDAEIAGWIRAYGTGLPSSNPVAGIGPGAGTVNAEMLPETYGGAGYASPGTPGGAPYGSPTFPNEVGSSGAGDTFLSGGAGGGLVKLEVAGTLTLTGGIDVRGADAIRRCGGGSGGSIFIAAGTLQGAGSLYASGGHGGRDPGGPNGGAGSGGRIAVYANAAMPLDIDLVGADAGVPGSVVNPTGDSLISLGRPAERGVGDGSFDWFGFTLPPGASYTLYLDDDDHLGNGEPSANHLEDGQPMHVLPGTATSASVGDLLDGREYWWAVAATDSTGKVLAASAVGRFTFCAAGVCPQLLDGGSTGPGTTRGEPPRIRSQPFTLATCGEPYTYSSARKLEVTGDGPLTFSATGPNGFELDAASGEIRWTPTAEQEGLHPVELTVTGPRGSDVQRYIIGVLCKDPNRLRAGCGSAEGPLAAALAGWLLLLLRRRRQRALRKIVPRSPTTNTSPASLPDTPNSA